MPKRTFKPDETLLLIIDVQERLHQVMDSDAKSIYIKNSAILIQAAVAFAMPIVVSEQYPRGLGHTLPEIDALIQDTPRLEKLHFSCWREDSLRGAIELTGRKTVIVSGIETHVCVLQTVMDLLDAGYHPVVAADAVCSRFASDRVTALGAMAMAGATVYSTESIAFMLLEKAGTQRFKQLSPLFKEKNEPSNAI